MENMKEESLFGKTCEQEETTKHIREEKEEEDDVLVHVHAHAEIQKEDKLKSAKAKVGEIREENERLNLVLARMVKEYHSLHTHFLNILQQEEAKMSKDTSAVTHQENEEETELVSLRLGRSATSSEPNKKDDKKNSNLSSTHGKERLALGLDCRFGRSSTESEKNPSSENTFEEVKEEEPTEIWPPSKILKTMRSDQDEEVLQQTQLKKARVSVRARCATPTMNDGCQWRKYGQKIAKGNPCPRAYYRCTLSSNCPVRKQVQRWAEDMSILITTYEGTHNHQLPISATAMASTTSAAASMLQCRSSTSQTGLGTSVSAASSTSNTANLQGLNFTFSETARPHQLYFPNSSVSNSNSHPTIVLDLTTPASLSHFSRLSSAPTYSSSSTSLNFSSPSSTISLEPKAWSSGYSNYAHYLGKQQPQEHIYQPYWPMNNLATPQQSLTETTAATKKVMTSNPNFQSAIAAAISSYIVNGGSKAQQVESSGLDMKWGKSNFPIRPAADSSAQNGLGFASSFLNKVPSSTPQQHVSIFPLNSLPFTTQKGSSGSPADVKDHV